MDRQKRCVYLDIDKMIINRYTRLSFIDRHKTKRKTNLH